MLTNYLFLSVRGKNVSHVHVFIDIYIYIYIYIYCQRERERVSGKERGTH